MNDKWMNRVDTVVTAWAGCMAAILMIVLTACVVGLFVTVFAGSFR